MNFFAPMARYLSGKLAFYPEELRPPRRAVRRPRRDGSQGGWAQEIAWSQETADAQCAEHAPESHCITAIAFERSAAAAPDLCILTHCLRAKRRGCPMSPHGHYFSFRTGSDPGGVVDRFEARLAGNRVTFYRNGRVGCTAPVHSASARPMESYEIRGQELHGPVRGTLSADGDILWSHGYTSRKERGRWERGATAAAGAGGAAATLKAATLAYNIGASATGAPTTSHLAYHAAEFAVGEAVGAAVAAEAAGGGAAAAVASGACSIQ